MFRAELGFTELERLLQERQGQVQLPAMTIRHGKRERTDRLDKRGRRAQVCGLTAGSGREGGAVRKRPLDAEHGKAGVGTVTWSLADAAAVAVPCRPRLIGLRERNKGDAS